MTTPMILETSWYNPEGCNRPVSEVSCTVQRKKLDNQKREQQLAEELHIRKMLSAMRPK